MRSESFIRKTLFSIWVILGLSLIFGLVFLNIPPNGQLAVEAIPGEPSPFFGGFRPDQRVSVIAGKYATLSSEPIYFAMAAPAFYRKATVRMEFLNEGQPKMQLGGRSSLDDWAFDLKDMSVSDMGSGWKSGTASFDLGPLAVDNRGEIQMVVSMPDMQNGNDSVVKVRKIEILYEREPLSVDSVFSAIKRRLSL